MKAKLISIFVPLTVILLLGGCTTSLVNLTPKRVTQNPSDIYTISLSAQISDASVIEKSFKAWIVIEGEKHEMTRNEDKEGRIFEYDYKMPPNRSEAKYYYEARYQVKTGNIGEKDRELNSDSTYSFSLTNRYVITIESERGPVGAVIPVLGRGFSRFDKIVIGGFQAETLYDSPVALRFVVPPLPANEDYQVNLVTGSGEIPVKKFHVDSSQIRIQPSRIALDAGDKTILLFAIPRAAPEGGLLVDVTTDIPDSIIMPEVMIPAGSKTINVSLKGAALGKGSLFITAPGFDEVLLPVTIRASSETEEDDTELIEVKKIEAIEEDQETSADESSKGINYEALIIEE